MRGRSSFAVVRALTVAIIAGSCTPATVQPTETAIRGGRLVFAGSGLDQIQPAITGLHLINSLIYETFVQLDPVTADIVTGFGNLSLTPDGRTYIVDIEPDAVWSDGMPIVAADWLTSLKAIARARTTGDWLGEFGEITQIAGFADYAARRSSGIAGVRADGKRLSVTMERVLCKARVMFAVVPPLPTHVFGRYVEDDGPGIAAAPENLSAPVVSGPFGLKEWRRGDHIALARNERYWRGPPLLDEIVFKFVAPATRFEQLANGGVTAAYFAQSEVGTVVPAAEALSLVKLYRVTPNGYSYIGWNTQSAVVPALRDKRVRQALAHAIDMDRAVRELVPYGTRVSSTFPSASWAFSKVHGRAYDPARAEALLRDAGYAKGASGSLEKDGRPLAFTLLTNANNAIRRALAQFVVDQLGAAGIRVTLGLEKDQFVVADRVARGEADAWILGWDLHPDPDQRSLWHSRSVPIGGYSPASGGNLSRIDNAELDRTLDEAGSPSNGDCSIGSRAKHYARVAQLLDDQQPYHFGYVGDSFVAVPARLRDFRVGPYSVRWYHLDVHRWWLAPEAK